MYTTIQRFGVVKIFIYVAQRSLLCFQRHLLYQKYSKTGEILNNNNNKN